MFIGSCKASNEDILNSINGISWVDAQKERMTIIQSHIDYLNTTIKSVKKIIEIVVKPYEGYINFLCTIPGIDRNSAISIIAEIGTDMSQFSSHYRLASWAGLAPGCNESAGKKKNNFLQSTKQLISLGITEEELLSLINSKSVNSAPIT